MVFSLSVLLAWLRDRPKEFVYGHISVFTGKINLFPDLEVEPQDVGGVLT